MKKKRILFVLGVSTLMFLTMSYARMWYRVLLFIFNYFILNVTVSEYGYIKEKMKYEQQDEYKKYHLLHFFRSCIAFVIGLILTHCIWDRNMNAIKVIEIYLVFLLMGIEALVGFKFDIPENKEEQ